MLVNCMPNELLSNIFLDVVSEDLCDEISFEDYPFPKYLTDEFRALRSVCSRWNSILVNDSRQWDVFSVFGLPDPNLFTLPLTRSRQRPITIVIETKLNPQKSPSWIPLLARYLKPALSRCIGIFLDMDLEEVQTTLSEWRDTPVPMLKSACFRGLSDNSDITPPLRCFTGQMPSLKRLMLYNVILDWDACGVPLEELELLELESEPGRIPDVEDPIPGLENAVVRAKALEHLTIDCSTAWMSLASAFNSENVKRMTLSSDQLSVGLHMTGLTLDGSPSRLTYLCIDGTIIFRAKIEPFLDFLGEMRCLERFTFLAGSEDFPDTNTLVALPRREHGLESLRKI
ncbi:hypothetical protein SISSUDRAFT_1118499, partial [Sistotremastrum suecicum HHB10207 ss-3]